MALQGLIETIDVCGSLEQVEAPEDASSHCYLIPTIYDALNGSVI